MNTIIPTVAFWKQAFKKHGARCVYCPEERQVDFAGALNDYITSSIDHLIPVSKGGANRPDNIVPACVICNFYKRDHLVASPDLEQLIETHDDGFIYVKTDFVPRYLELMRVIVEEQKEKKRSEFEAFRKFVAGV